jgi:uncharacterized membrane protein
LRTGIVQLLYVVVAVALGLVVPRIPIGFTVSSGRVVDSLLSVGVGIVTFIGLVYSLLFLVVQFGSTTFTPRLNLFRDAPIVWHAFAFFTGILVFAFTAAFSIGKDDQTSGLVPVVLVVALLAAVAVFRALQTAAFRSIQLASTLAKVSERGRQVIEDIYPEPEIRPATPAGHDVQQVAWTGRSAVLQAIDVPRLVQSAARADVVIELRAASGETIGDGAVIALVHGRTDSRLDREILKAMTVGPERTFDQDPALALRVLVDIALRALSPAVNDPTTAAQALDGLDTLLRPLAFRDLDVSAADDSEGNTRVLLKLPTWEEYVALAVDEVISMGSDSIQVRTRLERLLEDLVALAPPDRRPALEQRLRQIRS